METNILGLPSLTGYTPLKAYREGQVLKYNFKGVGPMVVDKSGHGNLGRLKPTKDPPRRKVVSWFPLKVIMSLDGEDDYVEVSNAPQPDHLSVVGWTKIDAFPDPYPKFCSWNTKPVIDYNSNRDRWEFGVDVGGTFYWATIPEPPGNVLDTWHFPALTYDGETLVARVYSPDGLVGEDSNADPSGALEYHTTTLYLGQKGNDTRYLYGKLADPRGYNRALSGKEVKNLYEESMFSE